MIKSADILYLGEEPPSVGAHAFAQLERVGLAVNVIDFPQDHTAAISRLRNSSADCIALYSPFQLRAFLNQHGEKLRAIGKPIISLVAEYTWGNAFPGYRQFEEAFDYADFYVCGQSSDTEKMHHLGRKAETLPFWVATDTFLPGLPLAQRIQRFCFVGHVNDYYPGIYNERRRLLGALQSRGLIDVLNIPRHASTAHLVADAYSKYAGVFCPPANGKGHSIRVYEAASCGALVAEVQPLDEGCEYFINREHRLALPEGISGADLCTWVEDLDFANFQAVASSGQRFCRARLNPLEVWRSIFAAADNAYTA
jgi:hypothetical protein